jgi:hypothetical protein
MPLQEKTVLKGDCLFIFQKKKNFSYIFLSRRNTFNGEDVSENASKISAKCSEIMNHFIEATENQYVDFAEMTRRLSSIQVQWNSNSPSDKNLCLNKPLPKDALSSAYPTFKKSQSFTESSPRSRINSEVEDSLSSRSIFESTENIRNRTPPLSPHTDIARRMSYLRQKSAQNMCSPKPGTVSISPREEGLPPLVQRPNRRRSTTLTDEDLSAEFSRSTDSLPVSDNSSPVLERSLFEGFDFLEGDNNANDSSCLVLDASNVSTVSAAKRTQQRLKAAKSLASTI